jgi:hypothetical protein
VKTENWQRNTRGLRLVGEGESGSALSPYGPMRAGLTISHRTQLLVLSELLSSLESKVETLESRYLEVLNILTDVMAHLVKLSLSTINEIITDETT